MGTRVSLIGRTLGLTITVLGVIALLPEAAQSKTITEIIDSTGDGGANPFGSSCCVAVDGSGNVYVTSYAGDNAFKIDPNGTITKIIDSTGDGEGNTLDTPRRVAVDGSGNVYVVAPFSNNAFKIDPNGTITEIINASGDSGGNTLVSPFGVAADGLGNVYVTGFASNNAFAIRFLCGDGEVDPGEECEDLNATDGDGCSSDCQLEQPEPAPLDHFKCWQGKDLRDPKFERIPSLPLDDQFGIENVEVKKLFLLCAPADKDGSGINDPNTHQCCYKIKAQRLSSPPTVELVDQFGPHEFAVEKPKFLCQPCTKTVLP